MGMPEWEIKDMEAAEKAVKELSSFVNSMGRSPKFFVKSVLTEHRTLQQSMFNVFLACVEEWSKLPEGHYDSRNEFTVKTSKKIMEALDGNIHAPFI